MWEREREREGESHKNCSVISAFGIVMFRSVGFMLNHISISYEYKVMIYNLNAARACVFSNDKSVGTIISYKTFAWV